MIYSIVEAFKEISLRNKNVWTFKYLDLILINAQPNNQHYSVIVESDPLMDYHNLNGILTLNMDVLAHGPELEVQDIASQIGLNIITKVNEKYRNILSLQDYSILFFTKKTDDVCSGARFTIQFMIPEFIDYCTMDESYLNDEEYKTKLDSMKDKELDLGQPKLNNGLDLKPIKL